MTPKLPPLHTRTAKSGLGSGVEVVVKDPKELSQRQMGKIPGSDLHYQFWAPGATHIS